jgi:hypothetical protein
MASYDVVKQYLPGQAWQLARPAKYCPPRHPPDFEPSFLELIGIL